MFDIKLNCNNRSYKMINLGTRLKIKSKHSFKRKVKKDNGEIGYGISKTAVF